MSKLLFVAMWAMMISANLVLGNDDSLIRNGSFEDGVAQGGWLKNLEVKDDDDWFQPIDSDADGMVAAELKAGPPTRYLWQDVPVDGQSGKYTLRWVAKGQGVGSVQVLTRDRQNQLLKNVSKSFPGSTEFEAQEFEIDVPLDANFIRVMINAQSPDAVIAFDKIELVRTGDLE